MSSQIVRQATDYVEQVTDYVAKRKDLINVGQATVYVAKRKDLIKFFTYLLVLFALCPSLIKILNQPWNISNGTMRQIASYIWTVESSGVSMLVYTILGLYTGLIILLFVDESKRFQAIILSLIMCSIFFNIALGNLFPNVSWTNFVPWASVGLLTGFMIGGGRDIFRGIKEFRGAARSVAILSSAIIIFVAYTYYFDVYTIDELSLNFVKMIQDVVVSFAFIVFFTGFIKYESTKPKIFILGPAKSGKTLLLIGLYLKALESMKNHPINPSRALLEKVNEFSNPKDPDYPWPDATENSDIYSFEYRSGLLFPINTIFSTIDYPGYFLNKISKYILGEVNSDDKIKSLTHQIMGTDKLMLLIDSEKYPHFNDMDILSYVEILKSLNKKKRYLDVRIVITKCDIFKDEFSKMKGESLSTEHYEEFRDFIMNKFISNTSIRLLQSQTFNATIYPIYYSTNVVEKNDYGEEKRVPLRDSENNLIGITFGFDKLINDLTKEG